MGEGGDAARYWGGGCRGSSGWSKAASWPWGWRDRGPGHVTLAISRGNSLSWTWAGQSHAELLCQELPIQAIQTCQITKLKIKNSHCYSPVGQIVQLGQLSKLRLNLVHQILEQIAPFIWHVKAPTMGCWVSWSSWGDIGRCTSCTRGATGGPSSPPPPGGPTQGARCAHSSLCEAPQKAPRRAARFDSRDKTLAMLL